MYYLLCFCVVLRFVNLSQGNDQCDEKKRTKTIKNHLETVKQQLETVKNQLVTLNGALEDLGCDRKATDSIEKSTQWTSAPKSSETTSTTIRSVKTIKKASDDICTFTPIEGVKKNVTCFLSEIDIENGLNLEKLVSSKLCTDIIMLVKHTYEDLPSGKSSFQYLNQARESANVEKWRSLKLKIFMHIGSWDDEKRLSAAQFSRFFDLPKARERLATALATRLQQNNFDGLLLSWYYPGCARDGCRAASSNELRDNANAVLFFKKLGELTKEKALKVKIAVEVSIRLVNIIFIYRLNDIVKYVDLLLFENTSPENRIALRKKRYGIKIHMFEQFGTLDNTSSYITKALNLNPKVIPGNVLMELETTTAYCTRSDLSDGNQWKIQNITAKNLCKLVLSAQKVTRNSDLKWPLNQIENDQDILPFNDFDYVKARVDEYANKLMLGGVWIRDLWADDMDNVCNCGAFPILRAANEAVGRSTCQLPNCPIGPIS